ncbi:MAG: hypothetical protein L6Q69_18100 [Zoogloea sp.]|nr:hypothetical protein [Zoogloea sp.]
MSIRVDSVPLIAGAVVVSQYAGHGILAEAVPLSGDAGGSVLANDIALPADAGRELRAVITTWPSGGTLDFAEDGSFAYTGPSAWFAYQLYVDGVAVGLPVNVTLTVGGVAPAVGGYPSPADVRAGVAFGANNELVGTMTGGGVGTLVIALGGGFGLTTGGKVVLH